MTKPVLFSGLVLIALYCLLAAFADAATRVVAKEYAAPQLFFFSGLIGVALSYASNRMGSGDGRLRPKAPRLLLFRAILFVMSCVFYFYAFGSLVFVEVFAFVALVPVFAGLLSGTVLGEPVRLFNWGALLLGAFGMLVMHPEGLQTFSLGHASALLGAITGACSMVLARLISRYDDNSLLQVFYPNLAATCVMGLALPFVFQPMTFTYVLVVIGYGLLLFAARWVLVMALTRLPAYVATPLINIQFIFMLIIGVFLFDEHPTIQVLIGAGIIMAGGVMLVLGQVLPDRFLGGNRMTRIESEVELA